MKVLGIVLLLCSAGLLFGSESEGVTFVNKTELVVMCNLSVTASKFIWTNRGLGIVDRMVEKPFSENLTIECKPNKKVALKAPSIHSFFENIGQIKPTDFKSLVTCSANGFEDGSIEDVDFENFYEPRTYQVSVDEQSKKLILKLLGYAIKSY